MRRVILLALGLVLVAGLVAAVVGVLRPDDGLVYTVAQVQAGLQQHRAAWAGRTVRVRGMVGGGVSGSTYMVFRCGRSPSPCMVNVPARALAHLLLVPEGADGGATNVTVSEGNQTLTYQSSTAASPAPGMLVLVQPRVTNTLLAVLRQLPLVSSLMPVEGQKAFQQSGVYRIHIPTNRTCDTAAQVCDDATLTGVP